MYEHRWAGPPDPSPPGAIEEILEVAIELMETEGVAALSLSAVARRLGLQPPSLYQYFPSKMAIYDALFQRGAETA